MALTEIMFEPFVKAAGRKAKDFCYIFILPLIDFCQSIHPTVLHLVSPLFCQILFACLTCTLTVPWAQVIVSYDGATMQVVILRCLSSVAYADGKSLFLNYYYPYWHKVMCKIPCFAGFLVYYNGNLNVLFNCCLDKTSMYYGKCNSNFPLFVDIL